MAKISTERLRQLKNEIVMSEKLLIEELEPIVSESVARYTGRFIPAYGGDWDLASEASGWKKAAERWRDAYHVTLKDKDSE